MAIPCIECIKEDWWPTILILLADGVGEMTVLKNGSLVKD